MQGVIIAEKFAFVQSKVGVASGFDGNVASMWVLYDSADGYVTH